MRVGLTAAACAASLAAAVATAQPDGFGLQTFERQLAELENPGPDSQWCITDPTTVPIIVKLPDDATGELVSELSGAGPLRPLPEPLRPLGFQRLTITRTRLQALTAGTDPLLDIAQAVIAAGGVFEIEAAFKPAYPDDPEFPKQLPLDNDGVLEPPADADINAPEAWAWLSTMSPGPVRIGIADTGVDTRCNANPPTAPPPPTPDTRWLTCDLADRVDASFDTTGNNFPRGRHGHGTMMASIIAATRNNRLAIAGVMPSARLASCRMAQGDGDACATAVAACLIKLADVSDPPTAAINFSWMGPPSRLVEAAIRAIRDKGVLLVASAGPGNAFDNDSKPSPHYPASSGLSNVISVTSASFAGTPTSSYGKRTIDLSVEQKHVPAILPAEHPPDAYVILGASSSQSAALVSGVVAMVKAKFPNEPWPALRNRILAGGVPVEALRNKTVTGRRLRAFDTDGRGALTCTNQVVQRRLLPLADSTPAVFHGGTPPTVKLRALSINCENPLMPAPVQVSDGSATPVPSPVLNDDGINGDDYPHDGEWGALWKPPAPDKTYTLSFWNCPPNSPTCDPETLTVVTSSAP
jgi:hypothetical protein